MTKLDRNMLQLAKEAAASDIARRAAQRGGGGLLSGLKKLITGGGKKAITAAGKEVTKKPSLLRQLGRGGLFGLGAGGVGLAGYGGYKGLKELGALSPVPEPSKIPPHPYSKAIRSQQERARKAEGGLSEAQKKMKELQEAFGKERSSWAEEKKKLEAARAKEPGQTWSGKEQRQFSRFGLDPERMSFYRTLGNLRSGMNLERQMMLDAMKGGLPSNLFGGGGDETDEGNLEAYA